MLISLGAERVTVLRVNVSAKMKKKRPILEEKTVNRGLNVFFY